MMSFDNWLAFSLASIILLSIPGPTVLAVIGHSIAHGRVVARSLVAAVCLGDSTCAVLSVAGLGLLLNDSDFGFALLQAAGGLCMVLLGIGQLRAPRPEFCPSTSIGFGASRNVFCSTYLVTALNPKGIVFFSAFLPLFVEPARPTEPQLWVLAATFVGLGTLSAALHAELASSARATLGSAKRIAVARRVSGGVLMLIGILGLFELLA